MIRLAALFFLAFALLFAAPAVDATPLTVPGDLNPGDEYRLAFVTSGVRNATSSDITVYNTFVDAAAETVPELAALGQDWKAIASTNAVNARTNTSTDPTPAGDTGVPIYVLNTAVLIRLADHYDDLWDGSVGVPLQRTETGNFNSPPNRPMHLAAPYPTLKYL